MPQEGIVPQGKQIHCRCNSRLLRGRVLDFSRWVGPHPGRADLFSVPILCGRSGVLKLAGEAIAGLPHEPIGRRTEIRHTLHLNCQA